MVDVFISYSNENKDEARILANVIEKEGFRVWWDHYLAPGEDYTDKIEETLDDAKAIIVLWSEVSRKSHWVRDEATVGRDQNKLLPVVIDASLPPLGFRQVHTVSLNGWNGTDVEPLKNIFKRLNLLVSELSFDVEPSDQSNESTIPFGTPKRQNDPAELKPKNLIALNKEIFSPESSSIPDFLLGKKKQRRHLEPLWMTGLIGSLTLFSVIGGDRLLSDSDNYDVSVRHLTSQIIGVVLRPILVALGIT